MAITISAVILAGGQGKRMGGVDKGLQLFHQKPLFMHVYQRLQPQVSSISINANRNLAQYQTAVSSVFTDELTGFQGPLSGILTGLKQAKTDFVLFVPCDCPFLPNNLVAKLQSAVLSQDISIAYAHDGEREHPTFCLISTELAENLEQYLSSGQRKMLDFMHQHQATAVDFSDQKSAFRNMNTPEDLHQ